MMNGLGVAGNFQGVLPLLTHLKSLPAPQGQILLDSLILSTFLRKKYRRLAMPRPTMEH